MKKILFLLVTLILGSCANIQYETVIIEGKNQKNEIRVQGMGVLYRDTLITAYHVVRDSDLRYYVNNNVYILRNADISRDRAFLTRENIDYNPEVEKIFTSNINNKLITASVIRNNQIITLTGNIVNQSGSILGYNNSGYIVPISGIIITDIGFQKGESGAPIFDSDGQLIDVVHVQ